MAALALLPSGRRAALALAVALASGQALVDPPAPAAAPTKTEPPRLVPAGVPDQAKGDMNLGNPKARIHVIEYASASCPHCARFDIQVFPAFKQKYIDTGKVRYTLRELLTPPTTVAAAGFLMARCAGPKNYFKVLDQVFRSQTDWAGDKPIKPIFVKIANDNGLSEAQFDTCLKDKAAIDALDARVQQAQAAGVQATPTFYVNGKLAAEGEASLQKLDAAIAAARRK